REREASEVLPWDHLDSGLDRDWLWQDWQGALAQVEGDDCRGTPCFGCGGGPQVGTHIPGGPTGRAPLPLTPVGLGGGVRSARRTKTGDVGEGGRVAVQLWPAAFPHSTSVGGALGQLTPRTPALLTCSMTGCCAVNAHDPVSGLITTRARPASEG